MPQELEADKELETPAWDSTPISMMKWLRALEEWLPTQNPNYTSLYEYGYILDKRITVTSSEMHAVAVRDGKVKPHTVILSDNRFQRWCWTQSGRRAGVLRRNMRLVRSRNRSNRSRV